jgi:hypothetical protein
MTTKSVKFAVLTSGVDRAISDMGRLAASKDKASGEATVRISLKDADLTEAKLKVLSDEIKVMTDKGATVRVNLAGSTGNLAGITAESDALAASGARVSTTLKDEGKNAESFGSKIKGAFSGIMSTGLLVGVAAGMYEAVKGGIALQASQAQLANAIKDTGHSFSTYSGLVDDTENSMAKFGYTGTVVDASLTTLVRATGSMTQAVGLEGMAANLAAAKHEDLATASKSLAMAVNGAGRGLKDLGITLPKNATETQRYADIQKILNDRIGGAAAASVSTFSGKLTVMKAQFENIGERIGIAVLPALSALAGGLTKLMSNAAAVKTITVAIGLLSGAFIGLKIAALLSIDSIKGALISSGIGLLLVAIGIAADLIITHWSTLKRFFKQAFTDIKNWAYDAWHFLSNSARIAWDEVKLWALDSVAGILGAFSHIPFVGHYFASAEQAIKGQIGKIQGDINSLEGKTVNVGVNFSAASFTAMTGTVAKIPGVSKAYGGLISGSGTSTSDSVLAALSNGEFVMNASAVNRYGVSFMAALNAQRFAGGGLVIGEHTSLPSDASVYNKMSSAVFSLAEAFAKQSAAMAMTSASAGLGNLPLIPGPASGSAAIAQAFAKSIMFAYGWNMSQFSALQRLWNQESGWNSYAVNPSSGAYGIPQALGKGHPFNLGDYQSQIRWGLSYISARYGSPANAWAHEVGFNWYDNGGMLMPGLTMALNTTNKPEMVIPAGGSAGGITVNVYTHPSNNPDETAKEIHEMLRNLKRHRGYQSMGLD